MHINFLELKVVLLALKQFELLCQGENVLVCTNNTTVVSYVNKEGGIKSGSLCALLWRLPTWCNLREIILRARHIPGHLNVIADKLPEVPHPGGGSVCNPVQSYTAQICVSGSEPADLADGRIESSVEGSRRLCFSSGGNPRSSGHQITPSRVPQNDSNCSRVAQHALVLGSDQHVGSDSYSSSKGGEPVNPTLQQLSSQGSPELKSTCLVPRASVIQQEGFSAEVATRIEAPQRKFTRAVYESKWAVFIRWCETNQVDFRSPSIKEIADFLLYLFQEKLLQPSTIDGYRTAIADKIRQLQGQYQ